MLMPLTKIVKIKVERSTVVCDEIVFLTNTYDGSIRMIHYLIISNNNHNTVGMDGINL